MQRSRWTAALVALGLMLAGGPVAAVAQQVRRQAPRLPGKVALTETTELALTLHGGRPVVEGRLDGMGPYPILIDTGAGGAVIDRSLVDELGLAVVGRALVGSPAGGDPVEGQIVEFESVEFGGVRIEQMNAIALDLQAVFRDPEAPRVVLTPHVLHGMLVTLDFPGRRLTVEHGSLPEAGALSYGKERPFPAAPIRIGEFEVLADVDTGSGHGLSLPAGWADRFELASALAAGEPGRSVTGEIPAQEAVLAQPVFIGSHRHDDLTVRFTMPGDVVNVGAALLQAYVVTLDPAARRFTLRYAGSS